MDSPALLTPLFSNLALKTRLKLIHSIPRHCSPRTNLRITHPQTRGHKTARRNRKVLNVPPYASLDGPPPVLTGGSGCSHRPRHLPQRTGDTIVFNPPSAPPNVHHTPALFLPRDDPRRDLMLKTDARGPAAYSSIVRQPISSTSSEASDAASLPPAVQQHPQKKFHLGPIQIEEMRRLRKEDSAKWTRTRLAEKFECSNMFVMTVCQANEEWRRTEKKRFEKQKSRWGPKRRKARVDRERRREGWTRGE